MSARRIVSLMLAALVSFSLLAQPFGSGVGRASAAEGVPLIEVVDIASGTDESGDQFNSFALDKGSQSSVTIGDRIFFAADVADSRTEVWVSDGTVSGTYRVANINPTGTTDADYFVNLNGVAYFRADDGSGPALWASDGTESGTRLVRSLDEIRNIYAWNNALYFAGRDANGQELWMSDGTLEGTYMLANLNPGTESSYPENFSGLPNALLFSAYNPTSGEELWSISTDIGIQEIDIETVESDGENGSYPQNFAVSGSTLYFTAYQFDHGRELWKSDGTVAGTERIFESSPGGGYDSLMNSTTMIGFRGGVVFGVRDLAAGLYGKELWFSDGTEAGTQMIKDLRPGSLSSISSATSFTILNDQILFNAYTESSGMELWISDGTEVGTQLLIDLWPEICDEDPCSGVANDENAGIVSSGAYAFFFAKSPTGADAAVERQIWRTDGTAEGTVKIGSGASQLMSDSGNRPGIRIAGNIVFFRGFTDEYGRELRFFTDPLLGEGGGGDGGGDGGGGGGAGSSASYTLSVAAPRFGMISESNGFRCASTDVRCSLVATEGSQLTLSSSVEPGYRFVQWNGCTSINVTSCTVALNSDVSISAVYGSRWLARFVGTGTTLRASAAATVRAVATSLSSVGAGDAITITGYAKTAGAKAAARAKALRRAMRAAGITAPITITTAASSATPDKRAKAVISVVWGVAP
jgi:ELWxxDGT repeat protein